MKNENKGETLKIKIGKIWNRGEGATEKFDLDVSLAFDDLKTASSLKGNLLLIKLKNEISAILKDGEISIVVICQKCLEPYQQKIAIPEAERQFLNRKIGGDEDPYENFLINFEEMVIDLHEMIRQEIFLHFPLISVCSKGCKGLCPICGQNLNEKRCKCKIKDEGSHKPFKDLKKIITSKHGKTSSSKEKNL